MAWGRDYTPEYVADVVGYQPAWMHLIRLIINLAAAFGVGLFGLFYGIGFRDWTPVAYAFQFFWRAFAHFMGLVHYVIGGTRDFVLAIFRQFRQMFTGR